jgi:tetratricopeptide (TPR) repeat protein
MRASKQILFVLFLLVVITCSALAPTSLSGVFFIKKRNKMSNDTTEVYRYARLALTNNSKLQSREDIKANIDSAEALCRRERIEFPSLLHLARAEYFLSINDLRNVSMEADLALKKSKNNDETEVAIKTMSFLGKYFLITGFFTESLDYFNNSITLARKNRIKGIIPENYEGITKVFNALGKLKEERNTWQMLINEAITEKDTMRIENGYFRLGTSYCRDTVPDKDRDFNRADSILRRCLDISMTGRDTNFIVLSLSNLGWNFYLEKKWNAAINAYNSSLVYSIPSGRYGKYGNSANAYGNLGTIYRDIGDVEKSIQYYLRAIEQAQKTHDIYSLWWVYRDMSEMYLRKRDTANAYNSYVLFKKYSDEYIKATNTLGFTNAKIRYEADSHNKELELLSLRVRNQKLLLYGYTALFILCIAIGILILSRAKINAKRRISDMNRRISDITQANLRQQMNPHFIFNTLNSIQYYMYQHDKLATNNYLTKFSSLMRKVLENSQHTSVPLRDELDALNLYLQLEQIRFKDKFDYEINIDDEIDTILYKVPTMLIQPYVENSICHGLIPSEGKGLVKIDLELKIDYISCIIEDNGIGREAALEKKKMIEKNHNSLGTQIASSRLELVNALYGTSLKTIYTDLKNDKGDPIGTRVEIHIPILT